MIALGKSLFCVVVVCILDRLLARFTWTRLVIDLVAYTVLALAIRVVRIGDVLSAIQVIRTRKQPAA